MGKLGGHHNNVYLEKEVISKLDDLELPMNIIVDEKNKLMLRPLFPFSMV